MAYEVQTPVFEGPFDLLLHLILREEVDIYDVSLSRIVDEYLAELDRILADREQRSDGAGIDLDLATEFLLIASTLVELKTRRLLPADTDVDLDDELAIWEERDLLLARLIECKTFKNAAAVLRQLTVTAAKSHPRRVGPDDRFMHVAPDLLEGVSTDDLRDAFIRALTPKPVPRVDTEHIAPIRASVTDAVVELCEELPRAGRMSFRELTDGLIDRIEVVVRFLAVLELFKEGIVELEQTANFGDIVVEWVGAEGDQMAMPVLADAYDG